jgi:ribosomal protein S18 acetylase RimI-like enzyme
MLERYPREVHLKDGTVVTLRNMVAEDEKALYEFFSKIPEEDRLYLKNDVTDRGLIKEWSQNIDYSRVLPVLAVIDGKIVADGTLHRHRYGWKSHLGTIRLVVSSEYQHRGLGKILMDELCDLAADFDLEQVISEVPARVDRTVAAFEKAGFKKAAVLEGFIKDQHGESADIAVMVRKVFPSYDI